VASVAHLFQAPKRRVPMQELEEARFVADFGITTVGLNVNGLAPGERLRVGATLLEVAEVCTPCSLMERIRAGLRKELWGRRGMLCRVLAGGVVRAGDGIERISA
jgi:MOSC domain-containing protein YiiM